jgi:predicted branched-subunit amino acid permease
MYRSTDFLAGVRRVAPIVPGLVPFGLVVGVAAAEARLTPLQAVGMSVVVFAGAAQLAAIDLLGRGAGPLVVVLTAGVINLRLVMYSASIAPHFRQFESRFRALCSYLLTDQAYALALDEYRRGDHDPLRFFLGVAATIWVTWQLSTVAGAVLGRGLPPAWGLSFTVPLVFLALLVPAVDDRPKLAAALVAGVGAVLGTRLPFNLGLVGGALVGVAAGILVERALGSDGSRETDAAGRDGADPAGGTADAAERTAGVADDGVDRDDDRGDGGGAA